MAELFRKSALDTLATPEQLDKQVKIVRPSVWIVCMALLVGVVTFILWSFTYHISNGVNAEGVVFSNHNVVQIKAERNCIVTDVLAVRGEYVETGDIIAVISNDGLLQEIEADRIALEAMETEDEAYEKAAEKLQNLRNTYVATTVIKSTATGYIQSVCATGNALMSGEGIATIMPDSGYNEVIAYVSLQTAQNLRVGMPVQVSPSYAPREEYGYMSGVVTQISDMPAAKENILEQMGTLSYVENILPETSCVEVRVKLNLDSDSKNNYLWSNEKGKQLSVELGTQCDVIIVTDEYRPIELLFE